MVGGHQGREHHAHFLTSVMAVDRFPEHPRGSLPDAEREVAELIERRRGRVPAPFIPLLKSPVVADRFEQLSSYLWSSLPIDVLEMVFLMTACHCRCPQQWDTHEPKALAAGLTPKEIATLSEGSTLTTGLRGDVSRFVDQLYREQRVSQAIYDAVGSAISDRGVVDLVMFCGSAQTVALMLNVRYSAPSADSA